MKSWLVLLSLVTLWAARPAVALGQSSYQQQRIQEIRQQQIRQQQYWQQMQQWQQQVQATQKAASSQNRPSSQKSQMRTDMYYRPAYPTVNVTDPNFRYRSIPNPNSSAIEAGLSNPNKAPSTALWNQ